MARAQQRRKLAALAGKVLGLLPNPRRTPFAFGYLLLLLATTSFARSADPDLVQRLQQASSSDIHNLLCRPPWPLLTSGLWVAGPIWLPYLWAFSLTVAPLERRIGGLRALAVFATGHVVATLLSQLTVGVAVLTGRIDGSALDGLDIGVSYGVLTTLGALAGLLAPRARFAVLAGAGVLLVHQLTDGSELVTAVGHPASLLIGILLWSWIRRGPRVRTVPVEVVELPARSALVRQVLDRA